MQTNEVLIKHLEAALDKHYSGEDIDIQSIPWREVLDGEEILLDIVCLPEGHHEVVCITYLSDGVRQRVTHRSFNFQFTSNILMKDGGAA